MQRNQIVDSAVTKTVSYCVMPQRTLFSAGYSNKDKMPQPATIFNFTRVHKPHSKAAKKKI